MKKVVTFGLATLALSSPTFADEDRTKEIESVVRNLLEREPMLIENALRKGMEVREQEAQEQANQTIKNKQAELFEDKKDPFIGNPNGSVKMVVFMDPYCGFCRRFKESLNQAVQEKKDLKVIYKTFPILSRESRLATEEELAALQQGKFVEFQERLYNSEASTREERLALAQELGLDIAKLNADIASDAIEKHIEASLMLGQELQINGTPAFIIGNELHTGYVDPETLLEMLNTKG